MVILVSHGNRDHQLNPNNMAPSQLIITVGISLITYFLGVIFYFRMERIAQTFHLDTHHKKEFRKGKPLLYRLLTSFRVIEWDCITSEIGISPKIDSATTHRLVGIANGYNQQFRKRDKYIWFLLLFLLLLKAIITLSLCLFTLGNFPPFLSKKSIFKRKSEIRST